MKKILALILLIASLLTCISCGGGDDTPAGMQLAHGSDDSGYYFYVPEEWTISNLGKISAAYASTVDSSSVSYTERQMPEGTVEEFFEESLLEFQNSKITPKVIVKNEKYTFGNAESAYKYVYDVEYSGHKFRVMQVFSKFEGRFGIFTFTALNENLSSGEVTQFDYYKEKITSVTENFKFVKKSGLTSEDVYEKDSDGYLLVSDKDIAGFSLYVPGGFTPDYASGIVSATANDGANITISKATATGVFVDKYWENREKELSAFVKNLTPIKGADGKELINVPATIGNITHAFSYEYTYEFNGETYHVYQVLGITTMFFDLFAKDGFVFTYTAKEGAYEAHLDEIKKVLSKVEF